MPYQIQIRKSAQKQLDKLPDDIALGHWKDIYG